MMVLSLMARVALLGSLASSVGGVVLTSTFGKAASSVSLHADAQMTVTAQFEAAAKAEAPRTKPKHFTAEAHSTNQRPIKTKEEKTMKNSITNKGNWWAASLLGVPVDGSSN